MLYKSKCRSVDCCGFHIRRDVEEEKKLDEMVNMRYKRVNPLFNNTFLKLHSLSSKIN